YRDGSVAPGERAVPQLAPGVVSPAVGGARRRHPAVATHGREGDSTGHRDGRGLEGLPPAVGHTRRRQTAADKTANAHRREVEPTGHPGRGGPPTVGRTGEVDTARVRAGADG